MSQRLLGSLARIADFDTNPFEVQALPRSDWDTGDFVQGEVVGESTRLYHIECTTGEMIPVNQGDQVIGAFGHRAATLEGVGSWMEIDGGEMLYLCIQIAAAADEPDVRGPRNSVRPEGPHV
jgi:hypothetical protein